MKLAVSILGIMNNQEKMNQLNIEGVDYLHLDVMDGVFVDNMSLPQNNLNYPKPVDIHLMTEDVYRYYEYYKNLDIAFITFHCETENVKEKIAFLKSKNIKVGLAIKPDTDINLLLPYLANIDLVLVMSVEPGSGGQVFINKTHDRIEYLVNYRSEKNLDYKISVDGGINNIIYSQLKSDIAVVGSYITASTNYLETINKLVIK